MMPRKYHMTFWNRAGQTTLELVDQGSSRRGPAPSQEENDGTQVPIVPP